MPYALRWAEPIPHAPPLALPSPELASVNIPFSGFYGSIWEDLVDREAEQLLEYWSESDGRESRDRDLPGFAGYSHEELEAELSERRNSLGELLWEVTDYHAAHAKVAEAYASAFGEWFAESLDRKPLVKEDRSDEVGPGLSWVIYETPILYEYEEMVSPRFYNFETDRLFAKFSLTDLAEALQRLLADEDGRRALRETIEARHTSRDGFISFYDNYPDHWLTKPLEDWDHNELGTLIRAWIAFRAVTGDWEAERLEMSLYEDLHEVGYEAFSEAVDWEKLAARSNEIAEEIAADRRRIDPEWEPPAPRCPETLELPL